MASFKICLLFFMFGMLIITDAKSDKKFKGKKQRGDEKGLFPDYERAYKQEPTLRQNVSYYLDFKEDEPVGNKADYVAFSYTFVKIAQNVIQNNANVDVDYDEKALKYADLASIFTSTARDYVVNVFDDVLQKHKFARFLIDKYCEYGIFCNAKIEFIKLFLNKNQRRSLDLLLKVGLDLVNNYNDIYPKLDETLTKKIHLSTNLNIHSSTYKKHILVLVDLIKQANAITLLGKEGVGNAIAVNVYE